MDYAQDCYYGRVKKISEEEAKEIEISHIEFNIIECHNDKCPEKYCKFSFFTGGLIPDSECEYYFNKFKGCE